MKKKDKVIPSTEIRTPPPPSVSVKEEDLDYDDENNQNQVIHVDSDDIEEGEEEEVKIGKTLRKGEREKLGLFKEYTGVKDDNCGLFYLRMESFVLERSVNRYMDNPNEYETQFPEKVNSTSSSSSTLKRKRSSKRRKKEVWKEVEKEKKKEKKKSRRSKKKEKKDKGEKKKKKKKKRRKKKKKRKKKEESEEDDDNYEKDEIEKDDDYDYEKKELEEEEEEDIIIEDVEEEVDEEEEITIVQEEKFIEDQTFLEKERKEQRIMTHVPGNEKPERFLFHSKVFVEMSKGITKERVLKNMKYYDFSEEIRDGKFQILIIFRVNNFQSIRKISDWIKSYLESQEKSEIGFIVMSKSFEDCVVEGQFVMKKFEFTRKFDRVQEFLNELRKQKSPEYVEKCIWELALLESLQMKWNYGSSKVCIVVGDNSPNDLSEGFEIDWRVELKSLESNNVSVIAITTDERNSFFQSFSKIIRVESYDKLRFIFGNEIKKFIGNKVQNDGLSSLIEKYGGKKLDLGEKNEKSDEDGFDSDCTTCNSSDENQNEGKKRKRTDVENEEEPKRKKRRISD